MRKATFLLIVLGTCALNGAPSSAQSGLPGSPELGVGWVNPPLDPLRPLHFYFSPDLSAYPPMVEASDSLTFRSGPHSLEIATAPPWFAPSGLKLDYDLLHLKAVTLSRFWIEVVVNESANRPRSFPRTVWVSREEVGFRTWPEFLLEVYSIEVLDGDLNRLRSGPSEQSADLGSVAGVPLSIVAIQGPWAQVMRAEGNESSPLRGWVRWRSGEDRLVVTFDLLS